MRFISELFHTSEEYRAVQNALIKGKSPVCITGLSHIHKAILTSSLSLQYGKKLFLLTADEAESTRLCEDIGALGRRALVLPSRDYTIRHLAGYSREYEHKRIKTLSAMAAGDFDVVLLDIEAFTQKYPSKQSLSDNSFSLKAGTSIHQKVLCENLIGAGYVRAEQVDGMGQFAVRGGIVDLFAPNLPFPVRIEFWGDEIDSLSYFEIEDQRRTETLERVQILPACEVIHSSYEVLSEKLEKYKKSLRKPSPQHLKRLEEDIALLQGGAASFGDRYMTFVEQPLTGVADYMSDSVLLISEMAKVSERLKNLTAQRNADRTSLTEDGYLTAKLDVFWLGKSDVLREIETLPIVYLDTFTVSGYDIPPKELVTLNAKQFSVWNGSLDLLLQDIAPYTRKGYLCVVLAASERGAETLTAELSRNNIAARYIPPGSQMPKSGVYVTVGSLSCGAEYSSLKFMLVSHSATTAASGRKKRFSGGGAFQSLEELKVGDYVVHMAHGIGQFQGIHRMTSGGVTKDYIKIKYAKSDVLYVPVTQLDLVSKYIGAGGESGPPLHRLGGTEWQKTRKRVKAAVRDMAKQLSELYAKRMQIKGYAFSEDNDLQNDFERRFEFDETDDQLKAIAEVKADMQRDVPMDRLLCGDVGFGKTEVALRAAFKCVAEGKQCAFLVPTTILAWQHYQTALKRIGSLPVNVDLLSRFRTKTQISQSLKNIKRGQTDLIIGTHRLISNDVKFKDLGLVIIDEEQRFGVAQKEKLKTLFPEVDVLTLTATPIPRTLNMAMSGLRDMSSIEEAPLDRHTVQTYVIEQDNGILLEAIQRELRRGGQVYYMHNRVESIAQCAARLAARLPDAKIAIAHGKMNEEELSDVWKQLIEQKIDVLVCTTIIETGVDVSNANTLIIEDADRMGLSQLHQIRGRVGRSPRRAYAYFCFRRGKALTEIAAKRLEAIREYTEFGSGFKIAMRDLEIRGAGSVLGGEQHGHLEAVGYDMYIKLLSEAIREEKGLPPERTAECTVDLNINASIPEKYIPALAHRLGIYRRIADIRNKEDSADVIDELCDRFGDPPKEVLGLIDIALIRNAAADHGIYEIVQSENTLQLNIKEFHPQTASEIIEKIGKNASLNLGAKPCYVVKIPKNKTPLDTLREIASAL